MIFNQNRIHKYLIDSYNNSELLYYCNLDKENPKLYLDMGFRLVKTIEPKIIYENCNDIDSINVSEHKKVYNCGINVYNRRKEE